MKTGMTTVMFREMRAAGVRCVKDEYIASLHGGSPPSKDFLDRLTHGAQVHRHVRRVRDQMAGFVEERAGEIKTLFDVHGRRRVGERHAHLFGDRHEEVVEHFEQDGVGLRADRVLPAQGLNSAQDQMIQRRHLRLPARLDDDGRVALTNDRRTRQLHARRERCAFKEWRATPGGVEVHRS